MHSSDDDATGSASPSPHKPHPILAIAAHGLRTRDGCDTLCLSRDLFALLRCLATHPPGAVVRYTTMALAVWPDETLPPRVADDRMRQHIGRLRLIAVKAGWPASILITEWGVGARLDWRVRLAAHPPQKSHKVLTKI